ncbi:MAG: hypothetical protein LBU37_11235 [Tannerellaceae bacterium]|nr:hypothetical protein [Tannerellaceae bacterium]
MRVEDRKIKKAGDVAVCRRQSFRPVLLLVLYRLGHTGVFGRNDGSNPESKRRRQGLWLYINICTGNVCTGDGFPGSFKRILSGSGKILEDKYYICSPAVKGLTVK